MDARTTAQKALPWLGRLSGVLMLALLGWLGADIYWTLSAPHSVRPSALMETDLQRAQQAIAGRHLFGVYVVASNPQSAPSDIRLNGAIAAGKPGQRAYALLSIEGKPAQLVREGEDLAPGITLKRVEARQVDLLRGGQTLTLRLPESGKGQNDTAKAGAPVAASAAPNPPLVASTPPPPIDPPKVQSVTPSVTLPPSTPTLPKRGRTRRSAEDDT